MRPSSSELAEFAQLLAPSELRPGEQSLIKKLDAAMLLEKLDYHGITLLADHHQSLPEELKPRIAQRKAMMAANENLKQHALRELFDAFKQAGLSPAVLFKGGALAYSVYSQPWLRPRSDTDIFIERQQRDLFEQVFTKLGYQKQFAIEGEYVSYQSTYSKALAGQSTLNIDLHWRINNRQILAKAFSAKELFENGEDLNEISANIRIPAAVDSILIASLHRLGHHPSEERLTWLYDIHLLAMSLSQQQWQSLLEKSAQKKLAAITLDALKTCEHLFKTDIPGEHLQALARQSQNPEPSQIFLQRDLPEWRYFLHDLRALKKISDKLGFIRETLLPSPSYVRAQMGTRSAALGYAKRLARGLRRIL